MVSPCLHNSLPGCFKDAGLAWPRCSASPSSLLSLTRRSRQSLSICCCESGAHHTAGSALSRRQALLAGISAASYLQAGRASAEDGYRTYSNKQDQYHIEYPVAWKETSKSGASILLQDPDRKSTTVGVTVTPVRITKLEEIGDPSSVADKLIAAEKSKESTKSVEVLNESQRKGPQSGTLMYDLEYELDSTRGRKRILSTVAVKNKKLYIVNGTYKCGEDLCNDAKPTVKIMQSMLNSFDLSGS